MDIEYCGLGKIIKRAGKRFIELPMTMAVIEGGIPLMAIRLPSMALYARPENANPFLIKSTRFSKRPTRAQKLHRVSVFASLLETRMLPGKPLEIPFYLAGDSKGRIGCLKITKGPAVLILYPPDDIIKVLKILCLEFGRIVFHDKRDMEMRLSIKRIGP